MDLEVGESVDWDSGQDVYSLVKEGDSFGGGGGGAYVGTGCWLVRTLRVVFWS